MVRQRARLPSKALQPKLDPRSLDLETLTVLLELLLSRALPKVVLRYPAFNLDLLRLDRTKMAPISSVRL